MEAEAAVARGGFTHLELQRGSYKSLECLAPYADKIRSLWVNAECKSSRGLERLTYLEKINLSFPIDKHFDFSTLPSLKHVIVNWVKHYETSLFRCKYLEDLNIDGYSGTDCQNTIGSIGTLKHLTLSRGKLTCLRGLSGCTDLESLTLSHLRTFTDVSELSRLGRLRKIAFQEGLQSLQAIDDVFKKHHLSHLDLRAITTGLNDIAWLIDFRELTTLLLPRVSLIDWSAIFSSKHLRKVLVAAMEDSGISDEEISSIAVKRGLRCPKVTRIGTKKQPGYLIEFEG